MLYRSRPGIRSAIPFDEVAGWNFAIGDDPTTGLPTIDNATLLCYRSLMELAMTPSIVKNVVRMPKQRSKQVRARISYMSSEQLERFLRAAKEFGPREHAMFLFAVAHGARAQEICNLRVWDINFGNEQVHIARLKGSLPSTQTLLKVKGNSLFDEKAVSQSLAKRSAVRCRQLRVQQPKVHSDEPRDRFQAV